MVTPVKRLLLVAKPRAVRLVGSGTGSLERRVVKGSVLGICQSFFRCRAGWKSEYPAGEVAAGWSRVSQRPSIRTDSNASTCSQSHLAMKALTVLAAVLALALPTQAALVSTDLFLSGDGLLTRDTQSGLDWLDHSLTLGRSFNDLSGQFGVGGQFQGFRFATLTDVNLLFAHADLPADQLLTPSLYTPALALITLIGGTVNSPTDASVRGIINLRFNTDYQLKGISAREQFGELGGITYTSCCMAPEQVDPAVSSWLLRPVPEPSTWLLMGLGVLAGVFLRRRPRSDLNGDDVQQPESRAQATLAQPPSRRPSSPG